MNRTGFLIALSVAAAVGVLFGLRPELDLEITRLFFDPGRMPPWAGAGEWEWPMRHAARLITAAIAAPAFLAVVLKLVNPRQPMLLRPRAAVLMIATLALAPGIVTNTLLKDNWGRPRPLEVTEFNGEDQLQFMPWWDPRGACPKNCSFVAGEPAGAFWTMAPAMITPPPFRAAAVAGALLFGASMGLLRISAGGHFFTDVVFSGVFGFLVIWLSHGLIYRWSYTRIRDQDVERFLEWLAQQLQRASTWVAGRFSRADAPDR